MTRTDTHLDAMLRQLGAVYYDSLHGEATRADVTRGVDAVAEHLSEQPRQPAYDGRDQARPRHSQSWSPRVGDVMTTDVTTVDRATPYKEITRLLAGQQVSGLPVLKMRRQVAGVVTEADLLTGQAKVARALRAAAGRARWLRKPAHPELNAGQLMTAPAVTIGPQATVPAAARLMSARHLLLLPVVDQEGKLAGVVSRRDLLSVFLRPDEEIARDVRQVLDEILLAGPGEAEVAVRDGVVTLTGTLDPKAGPHADLIRVAVRLLWDVEGVVDVIDRLGQPQPGRPARESTARRAFRAGWLRKGTKQCHST
jgi:CBS domain-containing protein